MKAKLLALAAIVLCLTIPAQAALKGCFSRSYDAAHLAKHKGQDVTFIRIQIGFEPNTEDDENILVLRLRGSDIALLNGFVCVERGPVTHCKIVDGGNTSTLGGSFVLRPKGDAVLLEPEGDIALVQEGTFTPRKLNVAANPEHKTFKLTRSGTAQCSGL